MSERPILFSAPMVRALLAGTKTQTRRVVKNLPRFDAPSNRWIVPLGRYGFRADTEREAFAMLLLCCPYGQPGDRLWVRETYTLDDDGHSEWAVFRADGFPLPALPPSREPARWRPSIHMPRWASRILLEITGVRVERLQDITRGDAMAEGCPFPNMANATSPRDWYAALWEEINGGGSWDANPWVWVLEFKRVEAATGGKP